MKKKKGINDTLKKVAWLVLVLLTAGIVISAVENKKNSNAGQVLISIADLSNGKTLINNDDVLLMIERSFGYNLEGVPLAGLDVERVERVLQDDSFIKEADVYVDALNKINISVTQREPVLRIIDKNDFNYYLDNEGYKIPTSSHYSAKVLVATGNISPYIEDFLETKNENSLRNIFKLSNKIAENEFLHAQIEQIYVNSLGEIILVPMIGNQKILLGPYEDIDNKLERLETFYKEGIPYVGWNKYKTINLKFKDQVVCKTR